MKKNIFLLAAFLFLIACTNKQQSTIQQLESSKMNLQRIVPNSDSLDLQEMKKIMGFASYYYKALENSNFEIKIYEFEKGIEKSNFVVKQFDTIQKHFLNLSENKNFDIAFYSSHKSEKEELLKINLPNENRSMNITFLKQEKNNYEWTELLTQNNFSQQKQHSEIPILSYATEPKILETGEKCLYCQLPKSGANFKEWYKQYTMVHYWVITITFK